MRLALSRVFQQKRYGGGVDPRIGLRRLHFESAIVVAERLPQVVLVIGVRAPSVFVGSSEETQRFPIGWIFRGQGMENGLGASGRTHLSQGQRHALSKPVIVRMRVKAGASPIVSREEFARGKRALHISVDRLDIVQPFGSAPPKFVKRDGRTGCVLNFRQVGHGDGKQPVSLGKTTARQLTDG